MNILDIIAQILGALTNIFVAAVTDMFVGSVTNVEDDNSLYIYRHRSQHYKFHQEKRELLINDQELLSYRPLPLDVDTDGLNLSSNQLEGCGQLFSDACVTSSIDDTERKNNNCLNKSFIDLLRKISRYIIETPNLLAAGVPAIPSAANPAMVSNSISEPKSVSLSESGQEGSTSTSRESSLMTIQSSSVVVEMRPRRIPPIGYERACRLKQLKQQMGSSSNQLSDVGQQVPTVSASSSRPLSANDKMEEDQLHSVLVNAIWSTSPTDLIGNQMQSFHNDEAWNHWFNARNIDGQNPFILEMNRSLRNEVSVTVALDNCLKLSADSRRNPFLLTHGLTYEYFETRQKQCANRQPEPRGGHLVTWEQLCNLDTTESNGDVFGLSTFRNFATTTASQRPSCPTPKIANEDLINSRNISSPVVGDPVYNVHGVEMVEQSSLDGRSETFLSIMKSLERPESERHDKIQFGTVTRQLLSEVGYEKNEDKKELEYTFFVDLDEGEDQVRKAIDSSSYAVSSGVEKNNPHLESDTGRNGMQSKNGDGQRRSPPSGQEDTDSGFDSSLPQSPMPNRPERAKAVAAATAFILAATIAVRTVANLQKNQEQQTADNSIPQPNGANNNESKSMNDVDPPTPPNSNCWNVKSLLSYVFFQQYQRQLALHYQYLLAQHIQQILPTHQHQELFMSQLLQYQAQLQQEIHRHVQMHLKRQADQQEEQQQQQRQASFVDIRPLSSSTSVLSSPQVSSMTSPPTSQLSSHAISTISLPTSEQSYHQLSSPISPPLSPSPQLPPPLATSTPISTPPPSPLPPAVTPPSSISLSLSPTPPPVPSTVFYPPLPTRVSSSCPSSLPLLPPLPTPLPMPPLPPLLTQRTAATPTASQSTFRIPPAPAPSGGFQLRAFPLLTPLNTELNINGITLRPPFFNMQQLMQILNEQSQYYQQQFIAALGAYEGILSTQLLRHQCISNITMSVLQQNVQSQCHQQQQHLHQQHQYWFYQQQIQLQQVRQLQHQEQQQLRQLQQQFQLQQNQLLLPRAMDNMDLPTFFSNRSTSASPDPSASPSYDPPNPALLSPRISSPNPPAIATNVSWIELPSAYPYPHYYYHHYGNGRQELDISANIPSNNSANNLTSSHSDPVVDQNDGDVSETNTNTNTTTEAEPKESRSDLAKANNTDDTKHEDYDFNNNDETYASEGTILYKINEDNTTNNQNDNTNHNSEPNNNIFKIT